MDDSVHSLTHTPRTILIVDDSPTVRKMIMSALRPLNLEFGEAGTGLEAIEQMAIHHYDGITLDLNMPDMHGVEFLQYIRHNRAFQKIPILVISTRQEQGLQRTLESYGVNQYISKPFQPQQVVVAVRDLFRAQGIQEL